MLQSWRKPAKLFSDFNTLQFAAVMSVLVFLLLLFFMTAPTQHHALAVDLAKADHPVSMTWANREDAMIVDITRDGKIFFGRDFVTSVDLPEKIADRLKDHGVERKVYIRADMRARWETVKEVLDAVHAAGLMRVAFLVNQRRSATLHM